MIERRRELNANSGSSTSIRGYGSYAAPYVDVRGSVGYGRRDAGCEGYDAGLDIKADAEIGTVFDICQRVFYLGSNVLSRAL